MADVNVEQNNNEVDRTRFGRDLTNRRIGVRRIGERILRNEARLISVPEAIPQSVRKACITEAVSEFADHDYVQQMVAYAANRDWYSDSSHPMGDTYSEMGKSMSIFPVLSRKEEREYFAVIDSGLRLYVDSMETGRALLPKQKNRILDMVAAHQILLLSNMRFVSKKARGYFDINPIVPLEDLVQEGNLGLKEAISKFDPSRGFRLLSYAGVYIERNIRFAYGDMSRGVRLPQDKHEIYLSVESKTDALATQLGRKPTDKEIAELVGISVEDYRAMMFFGAGINSLNQLAHHGDSDNPSELGELHPPVEDPETYVVEDRLVTRQVVAELLGAVSMSAQSRMILGIEHDVPGLRDIDLSCNRPDNGMPVDYAGVIEAITMNPDIPQTEIATYFGVSARRYREARTQGIRALQEAAYQLAVDPADLCFEPELIT